MMEETKKSTLTKWAGRVQKMFTLGDDGVARRCPNPDCGVMTQRIEGCNYLKCPRCNERWCFHCGAWGGGPSGRPRPHHVYLCSNVPTDIAWLDGHSALMEDARFDAHREVWLKREAELTAEKERSSAFFEQSLDAEAVKLDADLRSAAVEAREALRAGAAWLFFDQTDDGSRRLFEFAEHDLLQLLSQVHEKVKPPAFCSSWELASIQRQKARALVTALHSQTQALRSYRRMNAESGQ